VVVVDVQFLSEGYVFCQLPISFAVPVAVPEQVSFLLA